MFFIFYESFYTDLFTEKLMTCIFFIFFQKKSANSEKWGKKFMEFDIFSKKSANSPLKVRDFWGCPKKKKYFFFQKKKTKKYARDMGRKKIFLLFIEIN